MYRFLALACLLGLSGALPAQSILIENVRVFDGVNERLNYGHVLVENGIISRISGERIDAPAGATVIDGGNRVLTPGFIDLHVHLSGHIPAGDSGTHGMLAGAYAAGAARFFLDSGFTTIRDAGGTHPDIAHALNSGSLYGPRVFPSGAYVTQTAGHGDFRSRSTPHPVHSGVSPYIYGGTSIIADGVDATLTAVRENLKNGATQIKIMGGGGVMSAFDPIHTLQPSPAEIRAAVQAASDWGTYVLAHAYTSEAIIRLVENGVRCIEHGLLMDDAAAKLMSDNEVAVATQLTIYRLLPEMDGLTENNREKARQVLAGQENLIRLIKKYQLRTGFSTDFIMGQYTMLPQEFAYRGQYWTPVEVLRQATSQAADIIRMAGKLNRFGNFGEIREGWVADILLINGEPLDDLGVFEDPDSAFALIMKAGKVVKSTL